MAHAVDEQIIAYIYLYTTRICSFIYFFGSAATPARPFSYDIWPGCVFRLCGFLSTPTRRYVCFYETNNSSTGFVSRWWRLANLTTIILLSVDNSPLLHISIVSVCVSVCVYFLKVQFPYSNHSYSPHRHKLRIVSTVNGRISTWKIDQ